MKYLIFAAAAFGFAASSALAEEMITTPYEGSFDDAGFAVESAIVDRGLVVDHVSHVGDMLNRTGADVGADTQIFDAADIYMFCSAVLSRAVMEADPANIVHCPYPIFIIDQGGEVVIGHRAYPDGEMQEVQSLLSEIVEEAVSF